MKTTAKQPKTSQAVQAKVNKQDSVGSILKNYKNQPTQLKVIQLVSAVKLGNPYEFDVEKSDLGTGTATSQATRDSVNSWVNVPTKIDWEYEIYNIANGNKLVLDDKGTTDNPAPQKTGQRYDAGHSLGRQNGGLGDDEKWVFPQNPQINRGNMFNGTKTYKDWREPENIFHKAVEDYGKGKWKITAR